jgi:hypothetical protein
MRSFGPFLPRAAARGASVAVAAFAAALAGCGSEEAERATPAPAASSVSVAVAVERCTDRIVARATSDAFEAATENEIRAYAKRIYCAPFARRGWVYEDGTLSLAAYEHAYSEECVEGRAGEPATTVPCDERESAAGLAIIDCGLLRYVRRAEVQAYVERLRRAHEVECDDGTPLAELGAQ